MSGITFPAVVVRIGPRDCPFCRWEGQIRRLAGTLTKPALIDGVTLRVAGPASPDQAEHLRSLLEAEG